MFIIDTNVISELRKKDRAEAKVRAWAEQADQHGSYLSSITVFELRYGALLVRRRDRMQGELMLHWLQRDVLEIFGGRILPIDERVAMTCAELNVPDRRPERDGFIAATALVHDMTVVTRNTKDFEGTGAKLLNPWTI
jgi:predicted nucleic acid-binding protein